MQEQVPKAEQLQVRGKVKPGPSERLQPRQSIPIQWVQDTRALKRRLLKPRRQVLQCQGQSPQQLKGQLPKAKRRPAKLQRLSKSKGPSKLKGQLQAGAKGLQSLQFKLILVSSTDLRGVESLERKRQHLKKDLLIKYL